MKEVYIIILVAAATLFSLTAAKAEQTDKSGKLISTFQIVRFPNEPCTGSSATRNGTCYTSAECSDKGGTSSGSCADGFGVCCIFVIDTCGSSSSENLTYWDAPATVTAGSSCNLMINQVNDHICQLRLDFLTFVITGPSTTLNSEINTSHGIPGLLATAANTGSSWTTNCLTDSFSISSPNPANKPPVLCGVNSGMHMYVDADSDMTNVLSFIFQEVAGPAVAAQNTRGITTIPTRDWDITIMQYNCGYINQAPPGCTQYLWSDTGVQVGGWITSYNFQATGSKHLANQDMKVCIRREKTICWAAIYLNTTSGTFNISGRTAGGALHPNTYGAAGVPCGYQCELGTGITDADTQCSYDCIIVPGAFGVAAGTTGIYIAAPTLANLRAPGTAATNHSPAPPQLGGSVIFANNAASIGTFAAAGETDVVTYFTQHVPFQVTFKSDALEGAGTDTEAAIVTNSIGLKMSYDLIACS